MRLPMAVWGNRLGKAAIIVAVALAVGGTGWLAGHGAASPAPPRDDLPAPNLSPQVMTVSEGSIVSRLTVDAVVQADPAVEVHTRKGGSVVTLYRKAGQKVGKGVPIVAVKSVPDGGAAASPPGGAGRKKSPAGKPVVQVVYAPVAGRVAALPAPVGKEVAPGDTVASIDRRRFRAVASIDAKDIYRLYNRPKSIRLAIDHGPAPFNCRLLDYGAGANTGSSGADTGGAAGGAGAADPGNGGPDGGGSASGVQVSCRIPAGRRVFSGIQAKMAITTDSVQKAVVIPLSAVLGQADRGRVTVVGDDGRHEIRTVKLGINDGTNVQVVDGLEVGDKIFDRAPDDAAFNGPAQPGSANPGGGGLGGDGAPVPEPVAPAAP